MTLSSGLALTVVDLDYRILLPWVQWLINCSPYRRYILTGVSRSTRSYDLYTPLVAVVELEDEMFDRCSESLVTSLTHGTMFS